MRTGSLETCLRLLSLGAQANFFHPVRKKTKKQKATFLLTSSRHKQNHSVNLFIPDLLVLTVYMFLNIQEKGTTPLHVAAKAGQILQAELLVVYGADPGAPDINGRTPMDYARYKNTSPITNQDPHHVMGDN